MRVLVVEDDEDIAAVLELLLVSWDHEPVVWTHDFAPLAAGPQAVAGRLDVALVDYQLNEPLSGCAVAQALLLEGVRVVVITAAPQQAADDPLCAGLTILSKPLDVDALKAAL